MWKRDFWSVVDAECKGLSGGVGCYAFCTESHGRDRPWYVGKTLAKAGFKGEVFQDHKLEHFKEILSPSEATVPVRRGNPSIVLFPLVTDSWKISRNRTSSKEFVDWLETTLIAMALAKNPTIANVSKTRHLKETIIRGLHGNQAQGRRDVSTKFVRRAFLSE
jgi:hypothetical protein